MSGYVYQLTSRSCNACGMTNVQPREERYYDRYSRETVTEAVWVCPKCNTRFSAGEVSRVKDNEHTQEN